MSDHDLALLIFDEEQSGAKERARVCRELGNGFWMNLSPDLMCWYVWKMIPNKSQAFAKVVPALGYSSEKIEAILEIQSWISV